MEDPKELQAIGINEVVSQDPGPDTSVTPGSTVTITVNDPPPVMRIKGIGTTMSDRLSAVGIETVGELARADVATISDGAEVSESRAAEWRSRARRYTGAYELTKVPDVGTDEAEALADAANVTSLKNVQNLDPGVVEAATDAAAETEEVDEKTVETAKSVDLEKVQSDLKNLGL